MAQYSHARPTLITTMFSHATTNITVRSLAPVNGSSSPTIAPNFVGLSIEVNGVHGLLKPPTSVLLQNLFSLTAGPHAGPNVRIGGNSADESCFVEDGPLPSGCHHRITSKDLPFYKSFAASAAGQGGLNASFVIDVNFGRSPSPELAMAHVAAIGNASLWSLVRAVEIGNQVDIYAKTSRAEQEAKGHRNMSYVYGMYEREFGEYVRALRSAGMPPKRVQGGTYCSIGGDRGGFNGNVSRYLRTYAGELGSFSYHRYPTSHCSGSNATIGGLLAYKSSREQRKELEPYVAAARELAVPLLIGEGNSASCGGQRNVSDAFASALWAVDFLSEVSQGGVVGMNFHGGSTGAYPPIAYDSTTGALEVRPLYYGLRLFSELVANHSRWLNADGVSSGWPPPSDSDPVCERGLPAGGANGTSVCCLASCGKCGDVGCDKRAGGAQGCCVGAIEKASRSCSTHEAPCVVERDAIVSPVAQHATIDQGGTVRVVVVAKALIEAALPPRMVQACIPTSGLLPRAGERREAELVRLSAPSVTSLYREQIELAGQTWRASTDGRPSGQRTPERLQSFAGPGGDDSECWQFALPPLSAAMLVVAPHKQVPSPPQTALPLE
jgi:hypothetical protein